MRVFPRIVSWKIVIIGLCSLTSYACHDTPPAMKLELPNATFAGTDKCVKCHKTQETLVSQTTHWMKNMKTPLNPYNWKIDEAPTETHKGCEACHGAGSIHVEEIFKNAETPKMSLIQFGDFTPVPTSQQSDQCLQCHQRMFTSWQSSGHSRHDVGCASCHNVCGKLDKKNPKMLAKASELELCGSCHQHVKAAMERPSHHPVHEGKMTCSDCHDPHGSGKPTGRRGASATDFCWNPTFATNDLCFRCHADKRGPFLWEHAPTQQSCLVCHEAHGTTHPHMLVANMPFLCQRCHTPRHAGKPYSGRNTFTGVDPNTPMWGRQGCSNCHSRIHGSNHPSGKNFIR